MNQKVCIYCNVGHFTEIFEIQLEIAQQHLDRGDIVEFLFCDGFIPICEININKKLETCLYCIGRRNSGISLLKGNVFKKSLIHFSKIEDSGKLKSLRTNFEDLNDLSTYKLEDFNIGKSVYSSIADIKREHLPKVDEYSNEIGKFINAAGRIYFCMINYIKKRKPDLVYIYNGRHALERPVVEACKKTQVSFYTHEFAYNGGYILYANTLVQDQKELLRQFKSKVKNADKELINKAGRVFFENKLGFRQGNISFNKKTLEFEDSKYEALDHFKTRKFLPKEWNHEKHNVVIFQSSEFEDHTAEEFYNHRKVYANTVTSITLIANECYKRDLSIHFFVKLHPSFKFWSKSTQELDILSNLNLPENVTFILPDSHCDSYHLMDSSDKVIAFRSTAGIESAYRGKPVIMLEDHMIGKLQSVYLAKNHEDVISLICNKELPPLPIDDALKYGYFNLFQGSIPKYYKRDPKKSYEENWGLFKGKKVVPSLYYLKVLTLLTHKKAHLLKVSLTKLQSFLTYLLSGQKNSCTYLNN